MNLVNKKKGINLLEKKTMGKHQVNKRETRKKGEARQNKTYKADVTRSRPLYPSFTDTDTNILKG